MALIGYARVSTPDQSQALQHDALAAARVKVGKTAMYAALRAAPKL